MRIGGTLMALGLVLGACASEPAFDPASFGGGTMRVSHGGEGALTLYVAPDGSLAEFEGAEAVHGFLITRGALRFEATPEEGPGPLSFDMAAAAFGPDYEGQMAVGGACTENCTQVATAWWARGKERVTLRP